MEPFTSGATQLGAGIANSPWLDQAVRLVLAGKSLPTQPTRLAAPGEVDLVVAEIIAHGRELEAELIRRARLVDLTDSIVRVLRLSATYRNKTRFDDAEAMAPLRSKLQTAIAGGRQLVLTLPLGGIKAPNPLKTGDAFLPDGAEWVAWTRLAAVARAIAALTALPVSVLVIPDAPLHTADLGLSAFEVTRHLEAARADLRRLSIADVVAIADTLAMLPTGWAAEVKQLSVAAAVRLEQEPSFALDVTDQARSLLFSTNVRGYPWSLERQVLVAAAIRQPDGLPADVVHDAQAIAFEVRRKVVHYVAVNHALRSLAVPSRFVHLLYGEQAEMVRLTVHAKAGEAQPLLVQDSNRARPGLLPMHGVGLRFWNDRGEVRYATGFALEARMQGLVAVQEGERVVWYEDRLGGD